MTNEQCSSPPFTHLQEDYTPDEITPNMICAAAPGKDACVNDGGGPLITKEGNFYSIIGKKLKEFGPVIQSTSQVLLHGVLGVRMLPLLEFTPESQVN